MLSVTIRSTHSGISSANAAREYLLSLDADGLREQILRSPDTPAEEVILFEEGQSLRLRLRLRYLPILASGLVVGARIQVLPVMDLTEVHKVELLHCAVHLGWGASDAFFTEIEFERSEVFFQKEFFLRVMWGGCLAEALNTFAGVQRYLDVRSAHSSSSGKRASTFFELFGDPVACARLGRWLGQSNGVARIGN